MTTTTTLPAMQQLRTPPPPVIIALIEDERDLGLLRVAGSLGDVVALSARVPDRASVLGRATGVSRAVEVVDAALGDIDYLAVAHVLACAVRHLSASASALVLAGDRGRAAIGPAVAERLGVAHLGAVVSVAREDEHFLIERQSATRRRRYRGAPPVVLACLVPPADEMSTSDARTVEQLGLDILQITPPELRYRRRFRPEVAAPLPRRATLYPTIEHLGERLSRDGVWHKL